MLLMPLSEHAVSNNIFHPNQHGFRAGLSTCTNLLAAYDIVTKHLENHTPVDVLYIDFQKAFDRIQYSLLFDKLSKYHFPKILVKWLANFLTGRKQAVVVDGCASAWKDVTSGVPQGTIIAPFLFNVFVADMFSLELHSSLFCFADDTKLVFPFVQEFSLQEDLDLICKWANSNGMIINPTKSGLIHFGRTNRKIALRISNEFLPSNNYYKDLGILIESDLSFSAHVISCASKASVISRLILHSFSRTNPSLLVNCFKIYVMPLLLYGIPFFNPRYGKDIDILENVQRKFTKSLCGPKLRHLSYLDRLKAFSLEPVELSFLRLRLVHLFKIVRFPNQLKCLLPPFHASVTRGHALRVSLPCVNSEIRKQYFPISLLAIWNSLPQAIVSSHSASSFVKGLIHLDLSLFLLGRALKKS